MEKASMGSALRPQPKPYLDPKVCKIMAFMAVIMGLRLVFYILLGFRYVETLNPKSSNPRSANPHLESIRARDTVVV